jgi:hypothetical protein
MEAAKAQKWAVDPQEKHMRKRVTHKNLIHEGTEEKIKFED